MTDGERAAIALEGIEANVSRTGRLTKTRTLKQEARAFVRWRKRAIGELLHGRR
jgi:hypothetical protein